MSLEEQIETDDVLAYQIADRLGGVFDSLTADMVFGAITVGTIAVLVYGAVKIQSLIAWRDRRRVEYLDNRTPFVALTGYSAVNLISKAKRSRTVDAGRVRGIVNHEIDFTMEVEMSERGIVEIPLPKDTSDFYKAYGIRNRSGLVGKDVAVYFDGNRPAAVIPLNIGATYTSADIEFIERITKDF